MDLDDFKELFEYDHQVRKNYLHSFQKIISWEDMIKNRETAWLSMKDTLLHNQEVTSKTKKYLSDIHKEDLLKPVVRVNKDGVRRTSLVKDVLIHVFTEELHHRGEIIAIL